MPTQVSNVKIPMQLHKTRIFKMTKLNSAASYLGSSSDHVLDEITMARGINDSNTVLGGFELPQGDVDGDTTLTLSLQLVQHPGILEGAFAHLKNMCMSNYDTLHIAQV